MRCSDEIIVILKFPFISSLTNETFLKILNKTIQLLEFIMYLWSIAARVYFHVASSLSAFPASFLKVGILLIGTSTVVSLLSDKCLAFPKLWLSSFSELSSCRLHRCPVWDRHKWMQQQPLPVRGWVCRTVLRGGVWTHCWPAFLLQLPWSLGLCLYLSAWIHRWG